MERDSETRANAGGEATDQALARDAGETSGTGATGETRTVTHALSEADLALFALVTSAGAFDDESRLEADARYQRMASPALLAALLTTAASLHSEHPEEARFLSAQMRFFEPAYAEETVRASATARQVDPATGALQIEARCETEGGRRLAEAEFLLRRD